MIFITNWKIPGMITGFPIFGGAYEVFNSLWYQEVGTTIILIIFVTIWLPHFITAIKLIYRALLRWQDRNWTSDKNIT
jgi:hypothetical protein